MELTPPPLPASGSFESAGPGTTYLSLHRRVVELWRLQQLISSFILLAFGLGAVGVLALQYRALLPWATAGWICLAIGRAFLLFWYPGKAYAAWGYRLDGQVLEIKHGIWFRTIALLPLSRLQHVDLNTGPLERIFGLASLTLHTAGTQHATLELPGLEANEATRLRDQLIALGKEMGSDGL